MIRTRDELLRHLESLGISATTVRHPPLFTVEESRRLRGGIEGGHTKNLLVRDKKGRVFLVVAEETSEVDLKTLHARIGARGRLSFASAGTMDELLGVAPGAVTAFGVVNDGAGLVTVVLDRRLLSHDMVNCHPLTNEATTTIAREDLLKFLAATGHQPLIVDIGADPFDHSDDGTSA